MRVNYTKPERALRRELREQLKSADNEIARGRLREQLQRIRETAIARVKQAASTKADSEAQAALPKREDFATEAEFSVALEFFRLDLSEKAANRVLNSARTSLRARTEAEKKLKEIASRRLRLKSNGSTPTRVKHVESKAESTPLPKPLPDVTNLKDEKLMSEYALAKFLLALPGGETVEGERLRLAQVEGEMRRRGWSELRTVSGTGWNCYVDSTGRHIGQVAPRFYIAAPDYQLADLKPCENKSCICHSLIHKRDHGLSLEAAQCF